MNLILRKELYIIIKKKDIYLAKTLIYLESLDIVKEKEKFQKRKTREKKMNAELIVPIKILLDIKKLII